MSTAKPAVPSTDSGLLDLLRVTGPLSVAELAGAMEVTPTAIRQRLMRLMGQKLIDRQSVQTRRGRPKHVYRLTEKGTRRTGSNFNDLARVLWRELSLIDDPQKRREMLGRIARTMAAGYATQIRGRTLAERMRSLSELLAQRRIPVSVEQTNGQPVMTTHACPYPNLADDDRDVCRMETLLFSELLGGELVLSSCRLDGQKAQCRFRAR